MHDEPLLSARRILCGIALWAILAMDEVYVPLLRMVIFHRRQNAAAAHDARKGETR